MGELGLWMGFAANSKGWLVYNVVTQTYQVRYNIQVLKDKNLKPAMLMEKANKRFDLMAPMHPAIPEGLLFSKNISSLLQQLPVGSEYRDWVIKFDTVSGTPQKLIVYQDLDSEQMSGFSPKALKVMKKEQISNLPSEALAGMTSTQAKKLAQGFVGELNEEQIQAIPVEALDAMKKKIISFIEDDLSPEQDSQFASFLEQSADQASKIL